MEESDRKAFGEAMKGMAENFGAQLSPVGIAMRFEALNRFPIESIKRAAISLLAERRFTTMPTVADFLDHLGGGRVEDHAEIEAGKVWGAVKDVGGSNSVCFDDPVTQEVIVQGFGGWPKLCGELKEDQRQWFFREFKAMYGAYSRQGLKHCGYLSGWAPRAGEGPCLIGDEKKAMAVLEAGNVERPAAVITGASQLLRLVKGGMAGRGQ
jgi:hypothetical protein